jgi:hypothetical protein
MEQATALPAALQSPAAEAWQIEFAKMLPELERLSKCVVKRCFRYSSAAVAVDE